MKNITDLGNELLANIRKPFYEGEHELAERVYKDNLLPWEKQIINSDAFLIHVILNKKNILGRALLDKNTNKYNKFSYSVSKESLEFSLNATTENGNTFLIDSVIKGNFGLTQVIRKEVDEDYINQKNSLGLSALNYAIERDDIRFIKLLTENNNNNILKTDLNTLCLVSLDVFIYLVENIIDIDNRDDDGNHILHFITRYKQLEKLKYLQTKQIDLNCLNKENRTPIFETLKSNNLDLLKYLHEHGASIKILDVNKNSLLHEATLISNVEIVNYLIKNRLDVNAKNNFQQTPLLNSIHNDVKVTNYLLSKVNTITAISFSRIVLFKCIEFDRIDHIKHFANKDNINAPNEDNIYPLNKAFQSNKLKLVYMLLHYGADPNITDEKNNTLLHNAFEIGDGILIKNLMRYKVDYNIKNNKDMTVMECATNSKFKYLLEEPNNIISNNSYCKRCDELFNTTFEKVNLSCGHSICSVCLNDFKHNQIYFCSSCNFFCIELI